MNEDLAARLEACRMDRAHWPDASNLHPGTMAHQHQVLIERLDPWFRLVEAVAERLVAAEQAAEQEPPKSDDACCAGCGAPGASTSNIPPGGRALHWLRRGAWVCIECKDKYAA